MDEADLDEFRVQLSNIRYKPGKTGYITVYYNVTNPFDFTPVHANWNYLGVTYKDTAVGNPAFVCACLRRVNFFTTAVNTIACFNSNSDPIPPLGKTYFTHDFDFENYAYFITAYIYRNTVDEDAVLYALKLGLEVPIE